MNTIKEPRTITELCNTYPEAFKDFIKISQLELEIDEKMVTLRILKDIFNNKQKDWKRINGND